MVISFSTSDERYMQAALALARRGLGQVWPNPSVGCVIVKDGMVVGRGVTGKGGIPHGETLALAQAGEAARGATAYVTLEPCNHYGKTPPCTEALIAAGISRVVAACEDPDPRMQGRGLTRLREAGCAVEVGLCAEEARELNEGFFRRMLDQRPMVTLKLATSMDGRIATHTGESRWITGETARAWVHGLRARHDAIMVGIGTALADDPDLTCRLPGLEDRSPIRIVVDSRMRLPLTARMVQTAHSVPTWLVTLAHGDKARRQVFIDCGVRLIELEPQSAGMLNINDILSALAERGLTRVLVEGGSQLAASVLSVNLVDRLEWLQNPRIMGGDGIPAVAGFGLDQLAKAPAFKAVETRTLGSDMLCSYHRVGMVFG